MQNMTLRIASINHSPYVMLNETRKGFWAFVGGIDAYVINILKEKFCFKYEVVIPFEPDWGKIVNGRWTGVIGMVYRNEVDFGISNIMITEGRYESVSLSVPYNSDGWNLVSLAPRVYENKQAVLQPFKREVWLTLFMSVLISTCLLFTMQTLRSRFKWTPHLSWRNSLWNVVAALCQEGVKLTKMRGAVLVYFLFWVFSAMILQASYGGTLIGFLTFPSQEPSISTLQELANAVLEKDVKITYKKYSLAESLLENHERYGSLFTQTINSHPLGPVSSHVEGFERVLKDNFVFIANEFGCVYDSFSVDFTKLQMSTVFGRNYISVAVSSKFKYLKDFNAVLRRLPEQGLIHKWRSDILTHRLMEKMIHKKNNETTYVETSKSKPLKIGHLRGAFLLLIMGHTLGTIILISEIFYKRHMQSRRKLRRFSQTWNRY